MGFPRGLPPGNLIRPRARCWFVRVSPSVVGTLAFGSLTPNQTGTITGERLTAVSNPENELASVAAFDRDRIYMLDGRIQHLSWEWNRIGGCGAFSLIFTLDRYRKSWGVERTYVEPPSELPEQDAASGSEDSALMPDLLQTNLLTGVLFLDDEGNPVTLARMLKERWEVEIEVDLSTLEPATPVWRTVYRGTLHKARVLGSSHGGIAYYASGFGLIDELRRITVSYNYDYDVLGTEYTVEKLVAQAIVNHTVARTRVLWNPELIETISTDTIRRFDAQGSVLRTIQTLAFYHGGIEWGVNQNGEFYFMPESTIAPPAGVGIHLITRSAVGVDLEQENEQAPTHVIAIGKDLGGRVAQGEAIDLDKIAKNAGTSERWIQVPEFIDETDLNQVAYRYIQAAWAGQDSAQMNLAMRIIKHEVLDLLETDLPLKKVSFSDDLHGFSIIAYPEKIQYQAGFDTDQILRAEGLTIDEVQDMKLRASYVLGRGYRTLADEFERRDQPIQSLITRNRQREYPRYTRRHADLPDGQYPGELFCRETGALTGIYAWLENPDNQLRGWWPLISLMANVDFTPVGRNASSTTDAGSSSNPSTKSNDVAYFAHGNAANNFLHFSAGFPGTGEMSDMAITMVPRFALTNALSLGESIELVFRYAMIAVGANVNTAQFEERRMTLEYEHLKDYAAGDLIERFGWVLFARDLTQNSELQMYFGRFGLDPRDYHPYDLEVYSPKIMMGPFRAIDLSGQAFVDASRLGVGTSVEAYFTDFASLLALPSRRA